MENKPFSKIEEILKDITKESAVSNDTAPDTDISKCDFCSRKATYDGKTTAGVWAAMCQEHFEENGIGLGLGKGQRLIPEENI